MRLGALLPLHPLWPELGRIDRAAARLAQQEAPAVGADGDEPSVLPALTAGGDGGQGARRIQENRLAQQAALRQTADAELEAYLTALENYTAQREERRAAELRAVARVDLADVLRSERAAIEEAVRAELAARGDSYINLVVKQDALNNDLRVPPLLRPLTDPEELEKELARLDAAARRRKESGAPGPEAGGPPLTEADGSPLYVSARARLTRDLREVEAQLAALLAEEKAIEGEGRQRYAAQAEKLRQDSEARVAAQLAAERDENREENRVAEQRELRDQDIERERYAAEGPAGGAGRSPGASAPGPVRIAGPVAGSEARRASERTAAAARARLLRERKRLEAVIRADVRDAVRDVADARNLDVIFSEDTVGAGNDMTDRFRTWVRPTLVGGGSGDALSPDGGRAAAAFGPGRLSPRAPIYASETREVRLR